MQKRSLLGQAGEDLACRFLEKKGYSILERNFRNGRRGEIDIIAKKGSLIAFIEVKARSSLKYGTGLEAVTYTKQERISEAAEVFLFYKGWLQPMPPISFDVIEIYYKDKKAYISHHQGVF